MTTKIDTEDGIGRMQARPIGFDNGSGVVTPASAAAPLPVVQTGTPALATGAATEATLAAASAKLPASLGAKTAAGSLSIVSPSDQTLRVNLGTTVGGGVAWGGNLSFPEGEFGGYRPIAVVAGGFDPVAVSAYGLRSDTNALAVRSALGSASWAYAGATGGITNTADVAIAAAAGASVRNFLHSLYFKNTSAVASEIVVKDGSTIIWRGQAGASMAQGERLVFDPPLRGSANTAMNVAMITNATATIVSAQGSTGA